MEHWKQRYLKTVILGRTTKYIIEMYNLEISFKGFEIIETVFFKFYHTRLTIYLSEIK